MGSSNNGDSQEGWLDQNCLRFLGSQQVYKAKDLSTPQHQQAIVKTTWL